MICDVTYLWGFTHRIIITFIYVFYGSIYNLLGNAIYLYMYTVLFQGLEFYTCWLNIQTVTQECFFFWGNLRIKNMSKRVMNNIYHNYLHILYWSSFEPTTFLSDSPLHRYGIFYFLGKLPRNYISENGTNSSSKIYLHLYLIFLG